MEESLSLAAPVIAHLSSFFLFLPSSPDDAHLHRRSRASDRAIAFPLLLALESQGGNNNTIRANTVLPLVLFLTQTQGQILSLPLSPTATREAAQACQVQQQQQQQQEQRQHDSRRLVVSSLERRCS